LIDVAIPSDRNVIQKQSKKNLKYKKFSIEIQRKWNMECLVIPVIIVATGIASRGIRKYLEKIPGKHSMESPHKTAVLRTLHIIGKVLQSET
jgi:hypothetical protein